ncbi:MAG: GDP-L-fucose synthase [gamma proteobacterium symbiont of Bathyaustriella thionipta]|nr:GDP-L-fucose synthase [gamma proteobacterium symbiont of Bathyaustriella thionipta]
MQKDSKIYIAGHSGLVGSAIMRQLKQMGFSNLLTHTHSELNLINQQQVESFFKDEQPDFVFLAAAKVGGIQANNTYPADFIYQNLMIEANIIHAASQNHVQQLLFLGSSCIYPKAATQPIHEQALLTSVLEATNEPYALAKIAGIKLCESYNRQFHTDFRSVMPTNLYGPGDNFHAQNSHVIPALIRRFHEARLNQEKQVKVWGSGKPRREFLHVDDMAAACIHVMTLAKIVIDNATEPMLSHINIGTGLDCSIMELADIIRDVTGFEGKIVFDENKPDGTLQKLLDVSLLSSLGWHSSVTLREGLLKTYEWFLEHENSYRE